MNIKYLSILSAFLLISGNFSYAMENEEENNEEYCDPMTQSMIFKKPQNSDETDIHKKRISKKQQYSVDSNVGWKKNSYNNIENGSIINNECEHNTMEKYNLYNTDYPMNQNMICQKQNNEEEIYKDTYTSVDQSVMSPKEENECNKEECNQNVNLKQGRIMFTGDESDDSIDESDLGKYNIGDMTNSEIFKINNNNKVETDNMQVESNNMQVETDNMQSEITLKPYKYKDEFTNYRDVKNLKHGINMETDRHEFRSNSK